MNERQLINRIDELQKQITFIRSRVYCAFKITENTDFHTGGELKENTPVRVDAGESVMKQELTNKRK